MRVFAALGALAFPSYRPSKFSGENTLIFAVFTREATTRGSQMQLPNFSDTLRANADFKTCKNFKVIHGFSCYVSTCHFFFGRLATAATGPAMLKIAVSEPAKISELFMVCFNWKFLPLHFYLLDWLTAGLLPLPFQPVGGCVE